MVMIKKYKGYIIKYGDTLFWAEKNKTKFFKCSHEADVIRQIDSKLRLDEKGKEDKIKLESVEQRRKELVKHKLVFDAIEFDQFFGSITQLVTETDLCFNKNMMTTREMDPANVAMIYQQIKYKGTPIIAQVLINAQNVYAFIKTARKTKTWKGKISLYFDLKAEKDMYLFMEGEFGKVNFPVDDDIKNPVKRPNLKFKATIKMPLTELKNYVTLARIFGESVYFEVKDKQFKIYIERFETNKLGKTTGSDCISKYSIEYLNKKYFYSENITLKLSDDYPLLITDEKGNELILGPRVDCD